VERHRDAYDVGSHGGEQRLCGYSCLHWRTCQQGCQSWQEGLAQWPGFADTGGNL
jgi:hypothetical protein